MPLLSRATTGTFVTSLLGAGVFRAILDFVTRKINEVVQGEKPTGPVKALRPGAHELHIVKTAHLGLCQAMGALMCMAKYAGCPCGWLNR